MEYGFTTAAYVVAAVLFILSLGGLSGQESAKRAVWYGIAGMTLWLGMFAETFLAMPGVNPAALHRILVMSATTFDSLPHSGSIAGAMAMFQTTHKESYGNVFVLTVIIPTIFTLVGVVMAILFY